MYTNVGPAEGELDGENDGDHVGVLTFEKRRLIN
jgi:hypothetical protein